MLLLNKLGAVYDTYEGRLPISGSLEKQVDLLNELRQVVAPTAHNIAVDVSDNFFDHPIEDFRNAGIEVDYFKTDYAAGHTANYAGLYPLIAHHDYKRVWFNIEKGADDIDALWHDEPINHEWCKSSEYQQIMSDLYRHVSDPSFVGFDSTLRSVHDTTIYKITCAHPDLLLKTHSCNYGKPWCAKCPKCCFCYLLMTANLGEQFAQEVLNISHSLFREETLQKTWLTLFDPEQIAMGMRSL